MTDAAGELLRRLVWALQLVAASGDAEAQDSARGALQAGEGSRRVSCLVAAQDLLRADVASLQTTLADPGAAGSKRAVAGDLRAIRTSWRMLRAAVDGLIAEAEEDARRPRQAPRQESRSTAIEPALFDDVTADE